jgi:hypothetical protein
VPSVSFLHTLIPDLSIDSWSSFQRPIIFRDVFISLLLPHLTKEGGFDSLDDFIHTLV